MTPEKFVKEKEIRVKDYPEGLQSLKTDFQYEQSFFSLPEISVREDFHLSWNGDWYPTTYWTLRSLLAYLGIPENFAKRIPTDLLLDNIDRLKNKNTSMVAFLRDGIVINIRKEPYCHIKNTDVLQLFEKYQQLWDFESLRISDRGIELSFLNEQLGKLEPQLGDITKIGFRIINSETGYRGLKASFLLFRLICENGAVLADKWGDVRWSYDNRMRDETSLSLFEQRISTLSLTIEPLRQQYSKLLSRCLPDEQFVSLWRSLERIFSGETADQIIQTEKRERKAIFKQVTERTKRNKQQINGPIEPPQTTRWNLYELYNQMTETAKNYDFIGCRHLERLAGDLISK
jgi:hypothetical protein